MPLLPRTRAASKTNQGKRISSHLHLHLEKRSEGGETARGSSILTLLLLRTCDTVLTGPARHFTSFTPLSTIGLDFIGAHLGEIICEVARTFNYLQSHSYTFPSKVTTSTDESVPLQPKLLISSNCISAREAITQCRPRVVCCRGSGDASPLDDLCQNAMPLPIYQGAAVSL